MSKVKNILLAGGCAYCVIAAALTAKDWLTGVKQNTKCRCIEKGLKRFSDDDVTRCRVYTEQEIEQNPSLKVVELYCLPGANTSKKPYILFIPGGAYLECKMENVALPSAAEANLLGYTAFVLKYRIRHHTDDYAPVNDVAAAIKYITEHADELGVEGDDYMITGFSAGGNLAGLFASKELGFDKYNLKKPKALTLIYPWTNINAKTRLSGNIFTDMQNLLGKSFAMNVLIGFKGNKQQKNELCVHNLVKEDYPACYIVQGDCDFLVPKEQNADIFVESLKKSGVKNEYDVCKGLTHGFGIGYKTNAEGWVKKSIEFWNSI